MQTSSSLLLLILSAALFICTGLGFTIDTKLDLPFPPAPLDSSLSPKLVKAFYEINFVQVPSRQGVGGGKTSSASITDSSKGCPYTSVDLCKLYFVPTKVTIVQKVDELINDMAKTPQEGLLTASEVPVIQGLAVADEEKLLKELTDKINVQIERRAKVTTPKPKKSEDEEVPVFRGTVDVEKVLKSPEVAQLPEYRPRYPEIKRQCFRGSCWNYRT